MPRSHPAAFTPLTPLLNRLERMPGTRFLFTAACLVVVVAGLRIGAPILVPFALALLLAILSLPLLLWLRRRRVPGVLAVALTMLVNIATLGFLMLLASRSFGALRGALPRYVVQLETLALGLRDRLAARGVPVSDLLITDLINPEAAVGLIGGTLRGIASTVSLAFLVLLIMAFILAEATVFPAKLRVALGREDADLGRFAQITREVQHYLGIKTVISLVTGILVGFWVWMLGVDFPLFWGLIAFLFNYIPTIGSILAAIPAMLLALVQFGVGPALVVGLGYLVINVIFGNIVEPHLLGRRLGLSTLVVILSLLFWGWVWGPIGMLLSLPLTMIVKIMLENTDDFRWVAVLLGSGVRGVVRRREEPADMSSQRPPDLVPAPAASAASSTMRPEQRV